MASDEQTQTHEDEKNEAGPHTSKRRAEDGPSGVKRTVEVAARLYFDFCKRAARTVSRLKRDD